MMYLDAICTLERKNIEHKTDLLLVRRKKHIPTDNRPVVTDYKLKVEAETAL